jgi:hypothetical protein
MPIQKEKVKTVFTQILEPMALGVLALLFIIPIITVMNLTPLTKQLQKLDILGVTTQNEVKVRLVEGKHDIFTSENLVKMDDLNFLYSVVLNKRSSDNYSKPILEIENRGEEQRELSFFGQTVSNTRSNILLIVNDKTYRIQSSKGETYTQSISISPRDKVVIFLAIENLSGIQFSENFDMEISISESTSTTSTTSE